MLDYGNLQRLDAKNEEVDIHFHKFSQNDPDSNEKGEEVSQTAQWSYQTSDSEEEKNDKNMNGIIEDHFSREKDSKSKKGN